MEKFLSGDHDGLVRAMLHLLIHFEKNTYSELSPEAQARIDAFVSNILYFLTQPDLEVSDALAPLLIGCQHLLANAVALSSFRTTDPQVKMVLGQKNNLVRLLTLYSARNQVRIEPRVFFDADPRLASLWFPLYSLCTQGAPSETLYANLRRHFASTDPRWKAMNDSIVHLYFASTYLAPGLDQLVKSQINRSIQEQLSHVHVISTPARDSVAVLTAKWWPASAVYKSSYPLIRALRERFRLTLVHLGPERPDLDTSLFDRVLHVCLTRGKLEIGSLDKNDFQLAYYPDIGMTPESIWLSNLRLAPIQVMGYGHPVSTFGSRIDYLIGGSDSEIAAKAQDHYSERLVLIPGIGAHPVYPTYERQHPRRPSGAVRITCPWGCPKFNYPLLQNLREIARQASRPVEFQFLPNWGIHRYNCLIPFLRELGETLGPKASVLADRPYPEYMQSMEEGDLALDSYPFGGYNTVVDTLYLRKPMITYEGEHFYNRAASALMRKVGLEELIAHDDQEYIEKAVRLVDDENYRTSLCRRLEEIDLRALLCDTDEPRYFRKAIDYLIENHDRLQQDGHRDAISVPRTPDANQAEAGDASHPPSASHVSHEGPATGRIRAVSASAWQPPVAVTPDALLPALDLYSKWMRGLQSEFLQYPATIHVETAEACNARCRFCARNRMHRGNGRMSQALFAKIVGDLRDIPADVPIAICPLKLNEPFLDPDFFEHVAYAARELPNACFRIHSNCSLADEKVLERLTSVPRLEYLWVSLHSLDPDEYRELMGLPLERTLANVRRLIETNRSRHFAGQIVLGRVGDQSPRDRQFTADAVRIFADFEFEKDYTIRVTRRGGWMGEVETPLKQIPQFPCREWFDLNITCTGEIAYCCMDGAGKHLWGHAARQNLLDVYNQPRFRALREDLPARGSLGPCRGCVYI